jgi:hypothetical protein
MAICETLQANQYINPIGGLDLYDKDAFAQTGIKLDFLKAQDIEYTQFGSEFQSFLSIIDILMFNGKDQTRVLIDGCYDLY